MDFERALAKNPNLQTFVRLYSFSILEDYLAQAGMRERLRLLLRESTSRVIYVLSRLLGRVEKISLKLDIGALKTSLETYLRAETGEISFREAVGQALDLPQKLAEHNRRKFVVFIDEFQFLVNLKVAMPDLLHVMRSHFQEHDQVAYVISGSSVGMLAHLIGERREPFYEFFLAQDVMPFDRDVSAKFLRAGFRAEGIGVEDEAIKIVLEAVDGMPAWLNYVGMEGLRLLKAKRGSRFTKEIAKRVIAKLKRDPAVTNTLESEYAKIKELSPRLAAVFRFLAARKDGARPVEVKLWLEKEFNQRVPFSRVSGALRRLVELGVVTKSNGFYRVMDPVLTIYLRLRGES